MLILGFSMYLLSHVKGQETVHKNQVRIKLIKEVDGKRVVIDTVIQDAASFNMDTYMQQNGVSLNKEGDKQATKDKLILRTKKLQGDSVRIEEEEIIRLPEGEHRKIIIKKMEGHQDDELKLPELNIPEEVLKDEHQLKLFLQNDSALKGAIIIDGKELQMNTENEITIDEQKHGQKKEIRVMVIKKVSISNLNEEELKQLSGHKKGTELKVERLLFYPNPNNGRFKLSFELQEKGNTLIEIADKDGQSVYTQKLKDFSGKYENEIDISEQPRGTYYLSVKQGKHKLMRKLIVE